MKAGSVDGWVEKYVTAWRAAGPQDLQDVFTEAAVYRPSPFREELVGWENIARFWQRARNDGKEFTYDYTIIAQDADTAVIRMHVHYAKPAPQEWRDLWIVRLDDSGRCFAFEEWPFAPTQPDGHEGE